MEIFFSYYLVSLGLGQLASTRLSDENTRFSFGLNTFLGFSLIPILLFILNLVFKIPLNLAAYIVAFISLPGLVLFFLKLKQHRLNILTHPLFLLVIPIMLVFGLASNGYYPFSWDEFSHWATMPKQIFLHKEVTSDEFLIKNFAAYTPGWPLIVIFKDLIFSKSLHYEHFLFLPLFSSLLMLASIFDSFVLSSKKHYGSILGWIVIILAIFLSIPNGYFYQTNLIEYPMIHGLCLIFTLILLHSNSSLSDNECFARIGFTLAYCYLLKHTFMTMLPIVVLFFLFYVINGRERITIKNTKLLLYLVAPYLIFFLIWQWNLGLHELVQGYSPVSVPIDTALKNAIDKLHILKPSINRFLLLFISGKKTTIAFMLLFPLIFIASKRHKMLAILILSYLIFYYACLMWMYLTVFSVSDASELASFERFMSIPLAPINLFSFLILSTWAISKLPNRLMSTFSNYKYLILPLIIILLCAIFYRNIKRTPKAQNEIANEAQSLIKSISQNNLKQPKVLIVAQGGNRFEFHVANLESIGGNSYYYSVMYGTSWGEINDNQWRILTTKSSMIELLTTADILWIYKSDEWMDSVLERLAYTTLCKKPFEQFFIINNKNNTFTCVKKSI